jgi:exosome complex RNA-binding protein Csl4
MAPKARYGKTHVTRYDGQQLLSGVISKPPSAVGSNSGQVVIAQLVELNEQRAIPELRRISQSAEGPPDMFGNAAGPLIELARAALGRLRDS